MARDLEISEDIVFQRRSWVMQRVGWGLMALFLATGPTGAFGVGPLSSTSAIREDLKVSYERFPRAATDNARARRADLDHPARRRAQPGVMRRPCQDGRCYLAGLSRATGGGSSWRPSTASTCSDRPKTHDAYHG